MRFFEIVVPSSVLRLVVVAILLSTVAETVTAQSVVVKVQNPLAVSRPDEVVSLDWAALRRQNTALAPARVRVVESATGAEVLSQVLDDNGDGTPEALLFLAQLWPNEARTYRVEAARAGSLTARVDVLHDEHRDDVAWESDLIAFRTYGTGLWNAPEYEPLVSSGIDVWPKRVQDLVIKRWYGKGHDAYHIDTGEGADFYSVGPKLGAGGTAVVQDGKLYRAENFAGYRILAQGPLRVVFELDYPNRTEGDLDVVETKRITIDAGQYLFKSESTFDTKAKDSLDYAVGFVKRKEGVTGSSRMATQHWTWLSVWGPVERKNGGHGSLGTAAILPSNRVVEMGETEDHYLATLKAGAGERTVAYVGAGWTASRAFDSVEVWWSYLNTFCQRLENPVVVTFEK